MFETRRQTAGMRSDGRTRSERRSPLCLELRTADHRLEQFLRREPRRIDADDRSAHIEARDRQNPAAGRGRGRTAPHRRTQSDRQGGGDAMSEEISIETVQRLIARAPFHQWLGLEVIALHDDGIELKARWREEWVVNPDRRYTHGGILAALIDLAADWALVKKTGRGVPTIDLRVDYHAAAMPGDLTAKGKVIRMGGQFSCAEAQVFDKDGKLLASGRGTYFTAPPPPPRG